MQTLEQNPDAWIDAPKRQEIAQVLSSIEAERGLRIIFACESGSRAWGFASNDSDYDVRFLFVRPVESYLHLRAAEDAFDVMAPGEIDAAGWDIRKTAELMRRSNPPLMEWIDSPIVYGAAAGVHDELRRLRALYFDEKKAAFHYLSMASNVWQTYIQNQPTPIRKKYLYALRPLACITYIAAHHRQPPTAFSAVLEGIRWPDDVMRQVRRLVEDKRRNHELGASDADVLLNRHIVESLADGERIANSLKPSDQATAELDAFICRMILRP